MRDMTDFTKPVSTEALGTTTFMEAADVTKVSTKTTTPSVYNEIDSDIKAFLQKPYLLASGAWSTTDIANTNLANGSIASYLSSVPLWADKISGFNLIKADFVIRVEINASPFQQGKLLLHYLPCYQQFVTTNPGFVGRTNTHLIQKVQHPHVEMTCDMSSISIRVPYITPTMFYSLKTGFYDWGSWFLDVFAPLRTGAAAPASQMAVDYLVYGHFENIELVAPVVPQSSKKEYRVVRKNHVNETKENQGPIEEGLRKVGKVSKILSKVPILTEFAAPLEWASDIAADVAHVFGFSKPRELNGVTVVADNMFRYAGTVDGPLLSMPGGMKCDNALALSDQLSYTNEDEMAFAYLFKIPTFVHQGTWTTTQPTGLSLYSQDVCPQNFWETFSSVSGPKTVSYKVSGPMTYFSQFFGLWRGSIKITFKFIKTKMHSGKLQFTYIPINDPIAAPTSSDGAYTLRAIVDIKTEDEVTFELPYLALSDYLSTYDNDLVSGPPVPRVAGKISCIVLNELKAPESVSQNVDFQVFVHAGDDFEYAVPLSNTTAALPFTPQSSKEEMTHAEMSKSLIADQVIGNVKQENEDPAFHAERCIGEKILSAKQLLLRNTPVWPMKFGFAWNSTSVYQLMPHHLSTFQLDAGTMRIPNVGGDMYSMIVPLFAFFRGGVNWTYQDAEEPSSNGTWLRFGNFPLSHSLENSSSEPLMQITSNYPKNLFPINSTTAGSFDGPIMPSRTNAVAPTNFLGQRNCIYQHVPYYGPMPMSLTVQHNGFTTIKEPSGPYSVIGMFTGSNSNVPLLQRSVSDDFRCHFFIGCPPVPITIFTT